jgi:hypothetical protein
VQSSAGPQDNPSQEATDQQQLPLHMSISRTVPIKRVQIDSLQAALTKQLKPFKACRVQLQGLVCLVNDAATRSFVGVKVAAGEARVSVCLSVVVSVFVCDVYGMDVSVLVWSVKLMGVVWAGHVGCESHSTLAEGGGGAAQLAEGFLWGSWLSWWIMWLHGSSCGGMFGHCACVRLCRLCG